MNSSGGGGDKAIHASSLPGMRKFMIKPLSKPKKIKTLKKEKKQLEKDLLGMWQEIVKLKAGYRCEYPNCNKTDYLNAHHIHSRSKKSTRYDPDNGIALCSGHHSLNANSAHKDPDFKDTIIAAGVRSREFFIKLSLRANTPAKLDLNLVKVDLENELRKFPKSS